MSKLGSSKTVKKSHPAQIIQKKAYAWHAHDYREALTLIGSNEEGLKETEIKKRLNKFGKNKFSEHKPPGVIRRTLAQLKSPLTFVLVVALSITVVLEEYLDATVIAIALSIAIVVGVLQEGKASRAFKKLADSQIHKATVIRDGKKHEVLAETLVPGDIVEVQDGGQIPADLRLFHTKKLSINEAGLTGEWLAVDKQLDVIPVGTPFAEQSNMAWMGTFVSEGYGLGVVIATGDTTAMGAVAHNLSTIEDSETPLQAEMKKISMFMLYIISGLVCMIFALGLWQGQSLHDMLLMSIAIAVASVPEGLPAAVTIILAVGMEALLKRGGLVRNLLAAETLGSTTYILTDKTGTLTEAKMTLTSIVHDETTNAAPTSWAKADPVKHVLNVSLCASNAYEDTEHGKAVLRGDSVERAILAAAIASGVTGHTDTLRAERIDALAFTSENRFAAGLTPHGDQYRMCINGSPEFLLANAGLIDSAEGVVPIDEESRDRYNNLINEHTENGKRLVAVAYKDVAYEEIPTDEKPEDLLSGVVFMGLLVLDDPVRKGVHKAIAGVKSAGAEVILITGDNPATALSVARTVGIAGASENALTGDDLNDLTDEEILDVLDTVHVFARVLPQQKLRIARILQLRGEIVAMTGDGINDAPALKKANIGIAIGSGTEVAKESSDLVLLKDSFSTIYAAIEEGRRIISNLRKIVGYLLSTSLSEVVLIGTAMMIGAPVPILPAQILWANVIEEGLMSVAFAFEPGEKNAMERRPQDIHEEGVLSGLMLWFMGFVVVTLSSLLVAFYFYLQEATSSLEQLRSAMFLAVSIDSLFLAFAFRSLTIPFWQIPLRTNIFFVCSFLISLALLFVAITVPFFQYLLSYHTLPVPLIGLTLLFGLTSLLAIEAGKWVFFSTKFHK